MTEERQPNTELREKSRKWYPTAPIVTEIIAAKNHGSMRGQGDPGFNATDVMEIAAAFAASIQEEARQQIEELKRELTAVREAAKNCCGDAHMMLKAMDAHLVTMGIRTKSVLQDGIVTITYTNIRAESAEKQLAEARAQAIAAIAVLKGYEQWEANLLMCHESWGENDTPRITQELWDELVALQTRRNNVAAALERAAEGK